MRPSGSPKVLEQRRRRALALLRQGYQPVDVARLLQVDRRSVRRWKAAVHTHGELALQAKPSPGRPTKLTPSQTQRLERVLLKGAGAAGFPTELWTCPRVAQVLAQRFHVVYHVDHIGRLLHRLGWSPQKPQRQARERDDPTIKQWIRHDWPQVKKKRPG